MENVLDVVGGRPEIRIQQGRSKRFRSGHPWLFSNEIVMDGAAKLIEPGALVSVIDAGGEKLGVGAFNPHSLICYRSLSRQPDALIDKDWIKARLAAAASLRDLIIKAPYYRLIHAEADGLPGLIVDRYGDVFVISANIAAMERLTPMIIEAIDELFSPRAVVLKNSAAIRGLEGLDLYDRIAVGSLEGPVTLEENGAKFLADLVDGQKTGWFYDQRDNRAALARLAKGRRVIDFYSYAGGFAIQAALAGALEATAVDRSARSLALASESAALNGVSIRAVEADSFAEMGRLAQAGETFGVVIADPPAFVKSKKDLNAGAKGYRKMTRLAAALVEPGGFLLVASCSHHMKPDLFADEVCIGLGQAGRSGRILDVGGAGADHPLHPHLPESAYLKALLLQLD